MKSYGRECYKSSFVSPTGVGIFVTLIGAAMYDVNFMANIFHALGLAEPESTKRLMRIPVFRNPICRDDHTCRG